jgi:hypothetical protein
MTEACHAQHADGRKKGVVVHHVLTVDPPEIQLAMTLTAVNGGTHHDRCHQRNRCGA